MNWLAFWCALGGMSFAYALICWLADLPPRCVDCMDRIALHNADDYAAWCNTLTATGAHHCPTCAQRKANS